MTPSALAGNRNIGVRCQLFIFAHHAYSAYARWCHMRDDQKLKSAHQASTLSFPACADGVI